MTDDAVDLDDLGIDVATAELDDDELTRVLEALLLVVDTPVSVQTLATVTEQPVYVAPVLPLEQTLSYENITNHTFIVHGVLFTRPSILWFYDHR